MTKHIIVIGGGLGGISAAIRMAQVAIRSHYMNKILI